MSNLQRPLADLLARVRAALATGQPHEVPPAAPAALLDSLLDNLPVGVFMKEADSRRYVLWNRHCTELYGIPREAALGRTREELFGIEQSVELQRTDDDVLASGRLVEITNRRHTRPDGKPRVDFSRKVPLRDASGRVTHILGITLDTTARVALEQSLRRRGAILEAIAYGSERLMRASSDASDVRWSLALDAVLARLGEATGAARVWVVQHVVDRAGDRRMRLVHRWASLAHAVADDDPLLAEHLSFRRSGLDLEALRLRRREILELRPEGLAEPLRSHLVRLGVSSQLVAAVDVGSEWWGFVAFDACGEERIWSDDDREALATAVSLLGAACDVRAQRAALNTSVATLGSVLEKLQRQNAAIERQKAELVRASRMKSEFLAAISHELRTPLNAIIGFSDLLEGGLAGPMLPEQVNAAHEIVQAGQAQLLLINRLLELGQLDAQTWKLTPERVELGELLLRAAATQQPAARARGIAVEVTAERVDADVDVRLIHRLIAELLDNAIRFSRDGARVTAVVRREPDGTHAAIEVADQGPGIAAGDQERLFDLFGQLDASSSRRHGGTGIGLALVKRIAELHGGSVRLASTPGSGSRFIVRLPSATGTS